MVLKKATKAPRPVGVATEFTPIQVAVDDLLLDVSNPRLAEYGTSTSDQTEVLKTLWREMAVDEIALSIASNGYFHYEPLFAERVGGKLVVIEGNRRLAAVKALQDPAVLRAVGGMELPKLTTAARASLDPLPVIICKRDEMWQYLGFKHVNGPQNWESFAKAQYIAWVHNDLGQPLETISKTIGDRHATVIRLYNGVQTLAQAEKARVFNREDRNKKHFSFSHLYTGLSYGGIQKFLSISDADFEKTEPVPKTRIKELGELCVWLFGSKSANKTPLVGSQNPDLRQLDEAIQEPRGLAAVRSGLPLRVALDISRGDDRRFREALVSSKEHLQIARGVLLTGYSGEKDLLEIAKEASQLASNIVEEMATAPSTSSRRSSGRKK